MPAALTKDKKRLHDEEISVHLAWRSTLYITNFPESADDASMRDLFGKVSSRGHDYYDANALILGFATSVWNYFRCAVA